MGSRNDADDESQFPLVQLLDSSINAESAFRCLSHRGRCLFLDSSQPHQKLGRYSFVACDPCDWVEASSPADAAASLQSIRAQLAVHATTKRTGLPQFQGGYAGLFGYELAHAFEKLPRAEFDEFQMPCLAVGLYDVVVAFDHVEQRGWIVSQGFPETDGEARKDRAMARLRQCQEWLADETEAPKRPLVERCKLQTETHELPTRGKVRSNFSAGQYSKAVERTIEYIRAGDIFQANLSQRLLHPAIVESREFYLRLRKQTPSTFGAYFDADNFQLMSVSPERFLQVTDRAVEARPIKGTRPVAQNPWAEMYSGRALQASEKDRAENVMIVDLLRNDISRSCEPHSVEVPVLCGLESYGYVQHLVSVVRGRLTQDASVLDLLEQAFPGGSITGAPKIRAMEIITELERVPRGAYCGSLGYLSPSGDMDLNILIRTITAKQGWWQFPVGGGIVADSDPASEYAETWHKAAGILRAI